jgi:hypothetical protein
MYCGVDVDLSKELQVATRLRLHGEGEPVARDTHASRCL